MGDFGENVVARANDNIAEPKLKTVDGQEGLGVCDEAVVGAIGPVGETDGKGRPTLGEVEGQEVLIAAFADRTVVARRVDEVAGTEADGPVVVPDHFGHPVGRIRPAMEVVQIEQV